MVSRAFIQLSEKVKLISKPYSLKINKVINKVKDYEMPKRFKGTIVERWGYYWKNVYIDYREVVVDTINDCKARPIRASIFATVLGSAYYLCKHNPDEETYRNDLLMNAFILMQVSENIRNEESVKHIELIERFFNEGILRRTNFGIFSIIWLDNYDRDCFLYKAVCPYIRLHFLEFFERIIDIGFLDRWWIMEKKMMNYDINDKEFEINMLE